MASKSNTAIILGELKGLGEKLQEMAIDVEVTKANVLNIKEDVAKNTIDLTKHILGTMANTQRLNMEIKVREKLSEEVDGLTDFINRIKIRKEKIKEISFICFKIITVIGIAGTVSGLILRLLKVI
jgi:hypothetical protein